MGSHPSRRLFVGPMFVRLVVYDVRLRSDSLCFSRTESFVLECWRTRRRGDRSRPDLKSASASLREIPAQQSPVSAAGHFNGEPRVVEFLWTVSECASTTRVVPSAQCLGSSRLVSA